MSEGVYKNNLPINEWKYYHKNGKIEQQENVNKDLSENGTFIVEIN